MIYLDDLDPHCLTGGITFDGRAYSKLWDICDQLGLKVIGDVHTHPRANVRQSGTDAANPMVSTSGHVALIVPDFSSGRIRPSSVGVHQLQGSEWSSWFGRDAARQLKVTWW